MAEAFSIAAGAIQTADAGFKLYGALLQYIQDYVDANKHVKRIADEVRTTSWALQQLGVLLKEDDDLKLCKPEAISETEAALRGCRTAFDEVRDIVKDFLPPNPGNTDYGIVVNIPKRWKWPLKKAKVQLLLAQLERLKTTLLLVFKVLSFANKVASRPSQIDPVLLDVKLQLSYLVKAKRDAVDVEERLEAAQRRAAAAFPPGSSQSHSEIRRGRMLIGELYTCIAEVKDLACALNDARTEMGYMGHMGDVHFNSITTCYRKTRRAIDGLAATKRSADEEVQDMINARSRERLWGAAGGCSQTGATNVESTSVSEDDASEEDSDESDVVDDLILKWTTIEV
ncbi:hypothetical protein LTR10_009647 [Elasticomyces elasticus]|nr:hypothetical protein LTR10_009647 [Elasticomyces elasticus]KAK4969939.1 DNA-binding transcription factor [Elasticomyces elasticus]